MFGRYYIQYDAAVSGAGNPGPPSLERYAAVLLAELLDRAAILQDIAESCAANELNAATLPRAVRLFLLDAEESRARALRAHLVIRTEDGSLDPWSSDH